MKRICGIFLIICWIYYADTSIVPVCSKNGGICKENDLTYPFDLFMKADDQHIKSNMTLLHGALTSIVSTFLNLVEYFTSLMHFKEPPPPPPLSLKNYLLGLLGLSIKTEQDKASTFVSDVMYLSINTVIVLCTIMTIFGPCRKLYQNVSAKTQCAPNEQYVTSAADPLPEDAPNICITCTRCTQCGCASDINDCEPQEVS